MKLFLALEEEPAMTPEIVYDPEANPINTQLQLQEESAEANNQIDTIDEADTTAYVLTEISENVRATLPDGGLSQPAAQALTAAVEHMYRRLGFNRKLTPSMEGFCVDNRKSATMEAFENITNAVKAVWDAIVKAFKRFIEYVKMRFTSKKKRAEQLKKHMDDVEKEVNDEWAARRAEQAEDSPLPPSHLRALFHAGCKGDSLSGEHVLECLKDLANQTFSGKTYALVRKITEDAVRACSKIMESNLEKEEAASLIKDIAETIQQLVNIPAVAAPKFGTVTVAVPNLIERNGYTVFEHSGAQVVWTNQFDENDVPVLMHGSEGSVIPMGEVNSKMIDIETLPDCEKRIFRAMMNVMDVTEDILEDTGVKSEEIILKAEHAKAMLNVLTVAESLFDKLRVMSFDYADHVSKYRRWSFA